MKKLRIVVLVHEDLVPPEDADKKIRREAPWRTEFDVISTLQELGHDVRPLGIRSDLAPIRNIIEEFDPHIAFNLLEEFDGQAVHDKNVVGFLELLGLPYTGCNSRGLMIARDKALSKKILTFHRIQTPDFFVLPMGRSVRRPKRMQFPLIVKSLVEEASLGISQASVVNDDAALEERAKFIHTRIKTDALVEEYIDGRELNIGIIGNARLNVFPAWELYFEKMPDHLSKIATARAKWDPNYQERRGIMTGQADSLGEEIIGKIEKMAKRIYQVLNLSGYCRIDLRLKNNGELYVLEANPNPQIARGEDYSDAANLAGISYPDLIQRIVSLGIRWATNRSG